MGIFLKKRGVVDYMYPAIKTTQNWSIPITHILFPTKIQKGKPPKKNYSGQADFKGRGIVIVCNFLWGSLNKKTAFGIILCQEAMKNP